MYLVNITICIKLFLRGGQLCPSCGIQLISEAVAVKVNFVVFPSSFHRCHFRHCRRRRCLCNFTHSAGYFYVPRDVAAKQLHAAATVAAFSVASALAIVSPGAFCSLLK